MTNMTNEEMLTFARNNQISHAWYEQKPMTAPSNEVNEVFIPNARYFENTCKVIKPWGSYSDILRDKKYVLKTITINVGQSISLQRHHKRNEFWLILEGTGTVQLGSLSSEMTAGQTINIHTKEVHRATNIGSVPFIILEMQYGEECIEEDIERLEDNYGRR